MKNLRKGILALGLIAFTSISVQAKPIDKTPSAKEKIENVKSTDRNKHIMPGEFRVKKAPARAHDLRRKDAKKRNQKAICKQSNSHKKGKTCSSKPSPQR